MLHRPGGRKNHMSCRACAMAFCPFVDRLTAQCSLDRLSELCQALRPRAWPGIRPPVCQAPHQIIRWAQVACLQEVNLALTLRIISPKVELSLRHFVAGPPASNDHSIVWGGRGNNDPQARVNSGPL